MSGEYSLSLPRPPATVMFVDDDPAILRMIGKAMKGELYRVFMVSEPEEALAFLERYHVDLIVSDENMPKMRGSELLEKVGAKDPRIIRIMLSGEPEAPRGARYRFLHKPVVGSELRSVLKQALKMRELLDERLELRHWCGAAS